MNNAALSSLRLLLCASFGWLAGEGLSRTVLMPAPATPDKSAAAAPGTAKAPASARENGTARDWQEFLASHDIGPLPGLTEQDALAMATALADPATGKLRFEATEGRLYIMRRLVHTSPEEFPRLLDFVVRISDARVRRQVADAFFAAWAQHDPKAAIEAANKNPGISMAGLSGALKSWTEKDPGGLMAWLRDSNAFGWAKMQAQTNAFVYLTESDPRQAMQLATESGKPGDRRTVFINWYRRDPGAADAWIAAAPEAERRQMFDSWVGARSATDPAGAWQLALTQAPDPKQISKLLRTVFATWDEKDAPAARDALTKIPAEMWEPSFASHTGSMLGQKEAPALDTIAAHLPQTAQAPFWAGAASGAVDSGKSPDFAAAAFAHLPEEDSDDRMSLADRIAQQWLKADPRAASEWVRSLPRSRTRDMAAAALAEGLILTDPDAAVQWAADIRDDKIRLGVQKRLSK